MSTHEKKHDPEALERAKSLRYDPRDADFGKMGKILTGFFVFTAACMAVAYVCMLGFGWIFAGRDITKPQSSLTAPDKPLLAPVQDNVAAKKDIADLRHKEDKALHTYGDIADRPGIMHIPIEEAMKQVEQSGVNPGKPFVTQVQAPTQPLLNGVRPR